MHRHTTVQYNVQYYTFNQSQYCSVEIFAEPRNFRRTPENFKETRWSWLKTKLLCLPHPGMCPRGQSRKPGGYVSCHFQKCVNFPKWKIWWCDFCLEWRIPQIWSLKRGKQLQGLPYKKMIGWIIFIFKERKTSLIGIFQMTTYSNLTVLSINQIRWWVIIIQILVCHKPYALKDAKTRN